MKKSTHEDVRKVIRKKFEMKMNAKVKVLSITYNFQ
jgi:hypothetical protein